jgi:hypothetical protein
MRGRVDDPAPFVCALDADASLPVLYARRRATGYRAGVTVAL